MLGWTRAPLSSWGSEGLGSALPFQGGHPYHGQAFLFGRPVEGSVKGEEGGVRVEPFEEEGPFQMDSIRPLQGVPLA